jgi:hypothetical protein
MEHLIIEATEDTPKIDFDPFKGSFEISSRSLPENAGNFYSGIIEWFANYIKAAQKENNIVFHFDYVSTSSTKQLIPLFNLINELSLKDKVSIDWKYDKGDKDMLDTGKRLQKLCNVPFRYKEE